MKSDVTPRLLPVMSLKGFAVLFRLTSYITFVVVAQLSQTSRCRESVHRRRHHLHLEDSEARTRVL